MLRVVHKKVYFSNKAGHDAVSSFEIGWRNSACIADCQRVILEDWVEWAPCAVLFG